MRMFDVLIVGAGPAGSIAAIVLARAGARVCLIDRASFPRPKLCGDTVNPGALAILRRLGIAACVEPHALRLDGMVVTGDSVRVEGRYPEGSHGIALARELLDGMLVSAAVRSGVEFRDRVRAGAPIAEERGDVMRVNGASCASRGERRFDISARVTLAADGRRSSLALALGLTRHPRHPRRWAVGVHAGGVADTGRVGEMHIRRGHYLGVAPLPGGLASLCLVRPAEGPEDAFRDPAGTLRGAFAADPMLRDRVARAEFVSSPMVLGPLAVDEVPRVHPPDGLLLAGDAAGFVDPMTGDGLRFALRGGELAAHAALRALEHGWHRVHADLARARRREFGGKWRFNRMLRALVGSAAGVRGANIGARVAPGAVRALILHASDCSVAPVV